MLPKLLSARSKGTAAETLVTKMILATPPATACADLAGLAVRSEGFDVLGILAVPVLVVVGEDDVLTRRPTPRRWCLRARRRLT